MRERRKEREEDREGERRKGRRRLCVCVRAGCGNEVVFNTLDCVARRKLFNRIEHKDAIKRVQPGLRVDIETEIFKLNKLFTFQVQGSQRGI